MVCSRIWKITKENLLLVGISTVGVRLVTGLISFIFGAIGFVIAFGIGGGSAYLSGGSTAVSIVGIVIGALIFFAFVMVASIFSSYTNTAYHTCLYIWAREVETAKAHGSSVHGKGSRSIGGGAGVIIMSCEGSPKHPYMKSFS